MPIYERKSYTVSVLEEYTGRVVFTDVSHPTSAYVNKEVSWHAVAKVVDGRVRSPMILYYYVDGPASSIALVHKDGTRTNVSRGERYLVAAKAGDQPVGTVIDSRDEFRGVVFPEAGTYKIELLTQATEGAPAVGMALPITIELPAPQQIPLEYIAIAGSFGLGFIAGSLVASAIKN